MEALSAVAAVPARQCLGCEKILPLSCFSKHATGKFGVRSRCRPCRKHEARQPHRRRGYSYTPEYQRIRATGRHGITPEIYDAILAVQGGGCGICGSENPGGRWPSFYIDHDHQCCPGKHSCGKCVRGLLCFNCNQGLGHFRDDPARLAAASEYLHRAA